MFAGHQIIFALVFLAAGWFAHALRERRKNPRKRSRAIPKGTKAPTPHKPRKAIPDHGTPLDMEP